MTVKKKMSKKKPSMMVQLRRKVKVAHNQEKRLNQKLNLSTRKFLKSQRDMKKIRLSLSKQIQLLNSKLKKLHSDYANFTKRISSKDKVIKLAVGKISRLYVANPKLKKRALKTKAIKRPRKLSSTRRLRAKKKSAISSRRRIHARSRSKTRQLRQAM